MSGWLLARRRRKRSTMTTLIQTLTHVPKRDRNRRVKKGRRLQPSSRREGWIPRMVCVPSSPRMPTVMARNSSKPRVKTPRAGSALTSRPTKRREKPPPPCRHRPVLRTRTTCLMYSQTTPTRTPPRFPRVRPPLANPPPASPPPASPPSASLTSATPPPSTPRVSPLPANPPVALRPRPPLWTPLQPPLGTLPPCPNSTSRPTLTTGPLQPCPWPRHHRRRFLRNRPRRTSVGSGHTRTVPPFCVASSASCLECGGRGGSHDNPFVSFLLFHGEVSRQITFSGFTQRTAEGVGVRALLT
eukprot:Hpha_TRINITY_DN16943_c3_g8::TRINITY_DN16943_c3_g8_i2::g.51731::m.51731